MTTKGIYFNGKWYADAEASGGADGASAYEQAQIGGYPGTLSDFYADLASITGLEAAITTIVDLEYITGVEAAITAIVGS